MNSNDHYYLRINHKNTVDILKRKEQSKLLLSIFTTLASVGEDQIGNELNKYFNQLIPSNTNTDLYSINLSLANQYNTKHHLNSSKVEQSVLNVLQKDYNTIFPFDEENTEDLMSILTASFKAMQKYNITSHIEMLQRVNHAVSHNYDAVRLYIDNSTLDSYTMRSISFISSTNNETEDTKANINAYNNANTNSNTTIKSHGKSVGYTNSNSTNIQCLPISNIFTYPNISKKKKFKDILPIEIIILLNKFQSVKKFAFFTEGIKEKQIEEIILILLNAKWLFPNLLEIDYDLTNQTMQKHIERIFKKKMIQLNKKTTMYTSEESSQFTWMPNKEIEDDYNNSNVNTTSIMINESLSPRKANRSKDTSNTKHKQRKVYSYESYILEHSSQIELIVIYSYFISQLPKLQSLSLSFQDSYSTEIDQVLQSKQIYYVDFHFLAFYSQLNSLHELRVIFNSLDIYNFQGILGIINNNTQLFKLRLSFFNSDENYSPVALYKLCTRLKLNISDLFNDTMLFMEDNPNFDNGDVDHLMVNKLLSCFEENIEKLFHVLFNSSNIQELILFLALPKIISNNDSYIMVLIKFVINLLLFLSNERHGFKEFKIISPLLLFNYRRYPFIESCIEEVNLESNANVNSNAKGNSKTIQSQSALRDLTIQLGFDNVTNVSRMISTRLQSLFIGDFEMETLSCFVKYYTSKYFIENSQLNTLTISLGNRIVSYQGTAAYDIGLYFSFKPKELIEQNMVSNIQINTVEEGNEVIKLIYETNKVVSNNIEVYERKGLSMNQLLDEYLNVPKRILFALSKKYNNTRIMNINVINRLKEYLFVNKRNPFKIREQYQ